MTNEELLAPRVMVIAVWPGCPYKVGDILRYTDELWIFDDYEYKEDEYRIFLNGIRGYFLNENTECIGESEIVLYPHLLRVMQWWERRELSDMPEYIKFNSGNVYKAQWVEDKPYAYICKKSDADWWDDMYLELKYRDAIPATKEEYQEYQKYITQSK